MLGERRVGLIGEVKQLTVSPEGQQGDKVKSTLTYHLLPHPTNPQHSSIKVKLPPMFTG